MGLRLEVVDELDVGIRDHMGAYSIDILVVAARKLSRRLEGENSTSGSQP